MTQNPHAIGIATAFAALVWAAQPVEGPPKRAHHAVVYDAAAKRVLMMGGSTPTDGGRSSVTFDDMWAFNGVRWRRVPVLGDRLSSMRVAFDPDRRWLVSLGGYDGRSSVGVLRVFENGTWRTIADDPDKAGAESGFVYDSRRRRYVAFGGSSAPGQALGDTWIYSYGKWTKLTGESPPPRQAHVMVFDERRGRVVMFGGQGPSPIGTRPPRLGDLWELDGDRWTRRAAEGPSARGASGAAYDSKRGRTIVFGGVTADGFTGETWAWNGETWTKLADTGPEPRAMGYLAYDDVRDRVVLFGGRKGYPDGDLDDTWEFDGAAWHRVGS